MRISVLAGIVVCAILAWCGEARAESGPREQARVAFERGVALVDSERWEEALVAFDESLRFYPTQTALFNRALCLGALARPADAIRALEEHRRQYGSTVDAERRAQVDEELARLRARVGYIGIEVFGAEGAAVQLDGDDVGRSPIREPLLVNPGVHVASATAPDLGTVTERVSVTPGATESVVLRFGAAAAQPEPADPGAAIAPTPGPEPAPVAPAAERPGRGLRIGGFVTLGVAVAALGAALGLYLWNDSEFDTWDQENGLLTAGLSDGSLQLDDVESRVAANNDLHDQIQTVDAASWAVMAVGAAAAATAVTLIALGFLRRGGERGASAVLVPGPGGLTLTASF